MSPPVLNVGKDLSSYKLEVKSNTSWKVSLKGKDSEAVSWASAGRSSGSGDATVPIRVLENPYNEARSVDIVFNTAGGLKKSVVLTQEGDSSSEMESGSVALRIGTYNLRTSNSDTGINAWETRKVRLKKSILACDFDIVGFQELQADQQEWLRTEFGDIYDFCFFSPYSATGAEGTKGAQGIGYRKGKITLSDWHYFWAADNPDAMAETDVSPETGTGYKRGGCCGVFTHTASGVQMFVMNNHGCLFDDANAKYAHVYVDMEKRYNTTNLPSFFVGDMNESPNDTPGSPYMIYTAYWDDAYVMLPAENRFGPEFTYNGFAYPDGKTREDYVFYRGAKITLKKYTCGKDNCYVDGLFATDHFPVYVDVIVTL